MLKLTFLFFFITFKSQANINTFKFIPLKDVTTKISTGHGEMVRIYYWPVENLKNDLDKIKKLKGSFLLNNIYIENIWDVEQSANNDEVIEGKCLIFYTGGDISDQGVFWEKNTKIVWSKINFENEKIKIDIPKFVRPNFQNIIYNKNSIYFLVGIFLVSFFVLILKKIILIKRKIFLKKLIETSKTRKDLELVYRLKDEIQELLKIKITNSKFYKLVKELQFKKKWDEKDEQFIYSELMNILKNNRGK